MTRGKKYLYMAIRSFVFFTVLGSILYLAIFHVYPDSNVNLSPFRGYYNPSVECNTVQCSYCGWNIVCYDDECSGGGKHPNVICND